MPLPPSLHARTPVRGAPLPSSCRRRPARTWFVPATLLALAVHGSARADDPVYTPPRAPEVLTSGSLFIAGGGNLAEAVKQRFIELAGGPKARLVIIPTGRADPDGAYTQERVEGWKQRGAASAVRFHAHSRAEANDPAFVRSIAEATGVWFEGGHQSDLTGRYRGTLAHEELRRLLARGGVIGGTSAGAAVMGPVMIVGGNPWAEVGPGLGFLPGFVVDQHFLKRNRIDRLAGVLAHQPGFVGLGIDEGTAVVVQGRTLTVLGSSYVMAFLAAGPGRAPSVRVLRAGQQADLMALERAALARLGPPFPPQRTEPPQLAHGSLVLAGSDQLPDEVWERFIHSAGVPDALIVVVPTALDDPIPEEPVEVRRLRQAGARNVRVLHTRLRSRADRTEFVAPLRQARGIWFSNGRPWRLADAYQDTAAERAFRGVLARGGVIGGSSAGAAMLGEYLPRGDPVAVQLIMAEGYERGFGFLRGVAVDRLFDARRRRDLATLVTVYPQLLGLGIGEGTALFVRGSVMEVMGRGTVAVYDRQRPPTPGTPDHDELPAGARYDLSRRKRVDAEVSPLRPATADRGSAVH